MMDFLTANLNLPTLLIALLAHFKSPLAMGRDAFKSKHASSVSISKVIDTGVNSNPLLL